MHTSLRSPSFWVSAAGMALLCLVVMSTPAYAYIDPGTGSMVYQTLLAALLGFAFVLRSARARISQFARGIFGRRVRRSTRPARDPRG